MAVEKSQLKIGVVPLVDCAPLVVAKERGFFAEQGLDVQILRQSSWATIRDKLAVGHLDAAHMLASLPLSMGLGLGGVQEQVVVPMALSLGGNTITVSSALAERLRQTKAMTSAIEGKTMVSAMGEAAAVPLGLRQVIAMDQAAGRPPLTFAMVHPCSTHHYELRYWMAAAGIDPDRDVRLVVVPPQQMVAHLSAGNVAGFCVGEPWGSLAAGLGLAEIVARSSQIFGGRIEKVLGVTRHFADEHPQTVQAMVRAVTLAAGWCDQNQADVAAMLARPDYLNVPESVLKAVLSPNPVQMVPSGAPIFHAHAANFPWRSQAIWYLRQMQRWGHVSADIDVVQVASQSYRPALYRQAVQPLGIACPTEDYKTEGYHAGPWVLSAATSPMTMAADLLLDGDRFDPLAPAANPDSSVKEIVQ